MGGPPQDGSASRKHPPVPDVPNFPIAGSSTDPDRFPVRRRPVAPPLSEQDTAYHPPQGAESLRRREEEEELGSAWVGTTDAYRARQEKEKAEAQAQAKAQAAAQEKAKAKAQGRARAQASAQEKAKALGQAPAQAAAQVGAERPRHNSFNKPVPGETAEQREERQREWAKQKWKVMEKENAEKARKEQQQLQDKQLRQEALWHHLEQQRLHAEPGHVNRIIRDEDGRYVPANSREQVFETPTPRRHPQARFKDQHQIDRALSEERMRREARRGPTPPTPSPLSAHPQGSNAGLDDAKGWLERRRENRGRDAQDHTTAGSEAPDHHRRSPSLGQPHHRFSPQSDDNKADDPIRGLAKRPSPLKRRETFGERVEKFSRRFSQYGHRASASMDRATSNAVEAVSQSINTGIEHSANRLSTHADALHHDFRDASEALHMNRTQHDDHLARRNLCVDRLRETERRWNPAARPWHQKRYLLVRNHVPAPGGAGNTWRLEHYRGLVEGAFNAMVEHQVDWHDGREFPPILAMDDAARAHARREVGVGSAVAEQPQPLHVLPKISRHVAEQMARLGFKDGGRVQQQQLQQPLGDHETIASEASIDGSSLTFGGACVPPRGMMKVCRWCDVTADGKMAFKTDKDICGQCWNSGYGRAHWGNDVGEDEGRLCNVAL